MFVIRVIPPQSTDFETYIVVKEFDSNAVEVEFSVPVGDSLFAQIRTMTDTHLSKQEMVKLLKTKTIHLSDSHTLRVQLARLKQLCVQVAPQPGLYLDITRYDIAAVAPMNAFTMSMYDSGVDQRNNSLLKWTKNFVNVCRREAAKN